jgi:hypothetical protein
MTQYLIKQLADEITTPDSGKQSVVLADDPKTKVVLFSFAPGSGLAEHVAPFDASTPRGPSMSIRPKPGQCRAWAEEVGFAAISPADIDLPPYHYGLVLEPGR